MKAGSAIEVIKQSLKIAYDEHIGRLLAIPQPHIDSILPNKRLPLQDILKRYNSEVFNEIIRYGDQLQSEIASVLEKVKGTAEAPPFEAVMDVLEEFVQPDLYKKRFAIFTKSIERRMRGFGIKFDIAEHRVDIPESLATVDANNGCRKIQSKIANCINKLYLESDPSEEQKATGFYATVNRTYKKHQVLFWVIGISISVILGAMAL